MIRFRLSSSTRVPAALVLAGLSLALTFAPSGAQDRPPTGAEATAPETATPEKDRGQILADLYDRLGRESDATDAQVIVDAIEKLWLRSGSDTIDLLMRRAIALVNTEDLDVALEILDEVVALAPNYSEGWNQRATVHFMKQDYDRSLGDLRNVLRLDPRHFKAINGLGLIMERLGDKPAALKAFRKVLEIYPQLDTARRSVEELAREVEGQGI